MLGAQCRMDAAEADVVARSWMEQVCAQGKLLYLRRARSGGGTAWEHSAAMQQHVADVPFHDFQDNQNNCIVNPNAESLHQLVAKIALLDNAMPAPAKLSNAHSHTHTHTHAQTCARPKPYWITECCTEAAVLVDGSTYRSCQAVLNLSVTSSTLILHTLGNMGPTNSR
eukprot:341303-Amphidinium_carterae.1